MQKRQKVTVIFDIGKTNKKFFLFDDNLKKIHEEYRKFEYITDEDGHPTENLEQLVDWIKEIFNSVLLSDEYEVKAVNFSTYGASLVHLDANGKVLTPLYNYTKPLPKNILDMFYNTYGDIKTMSKETASPQQAALNSGLQLYWIKKTKPELFKKIKYIVHFPQYLSYLFSGIPASEYTSIGCHTNLWNFNTDSYHKWIYDEEIDKLLPPIMQTTRTVVHPKYGYKIGLGIHDSSSALLPYLLSNKNPFVLVSTGTWSVTLNAFCNEQLTNEDVKNNCLNYMQIDGKSVKAARFFMGDAYKKQVNELCAFFNKESNYHKTIKFNPAIYDKLKLDTNNYFNFSNHSLELKPVTKDSLQQFTSFEEALHKLIMELVIVQTESIHAAIGNTTSIKNMYIDGGFTDNDVFTELMALTFKEFKVFTSNSPLGSALGAALVVSNDSLDANFFKENYQVKNLTPIIPTK